MNFIKNNLANAFTLGNLFSGSIGIIHLLNGDYQTSAICLIISLVFDFLDGFVARALGSNSNLGAQLDSLADMVSFGLLPGVAMFQLLAPLGNYFFGIPLPFDVKYFGLFITVFSCLRLAIFNLDDEQTYYFKGLNTPSNTILIFGIYYYLEHISKSFDKLNYFLMNLNYKLTILLAITVVSSWLLVSPIKMLAMKFRSKKLQDNYSKLILLVGAVLIIGIFRFMGIPLVIVYYIIISLLFQKEIK